MTFKTLAILMLCLTFALTGCVGGGGSGGSVDSTPTNGGAVGGTGSGGTGVGNSSIPSANAEILVDLEGQALTLRAAEVRSNGQPSLVDAALTITDGALSNGSASASGTIDVFGERVTITNNRGTLANGKDIAILIEPSRFGEYAAVFEAVVSGPNVAGDDGETAYVFGFETDASAVSALSNPSVFYTGSFQAFGTYGTVNQTEYEGTVTVTADFSGPDSVDVDLDGQIGTQAVDLQARDLPVTGNGFAGSLICPTDCSNDGTSQVDATFYGPNAEEIGGVLAIIIRTGGADYDGVGSFVITNQ